MLFRKRLLVVLGLTMGLLLATPCSQAHSAEPNSAEEIETTIRKFFTSMATRDATGLRDVLTDRLIGIESGPRPNVHMIDTTQDSQLLPKNDDWENVRLNKFQVKVAQPHNSVAMVSFVLSTPVDDKMITMLEEMLKSTDSGVTEEQRAQARNLVRDRAKTHSLFATLAHQGGKWKIICLTLPK